MSSNMSRRGILSAACGGTKSIRYRQDIETGEFICTTPVSKLSQVVDILEESIEGIEITISPPLSSDDRLSLLVAKELAFQIPIVANISFEDDRWNFFADLKTLAAHGVEKIVMTDLNDEKRRDLREINRIQKLGLAFLS